MIFLSLYLIIGVVVCALQKEPDKKDKSLEAYHMYFLLFVFICWPVVVLWWVMNRIRFTGVLQIIFSAAAVFIVLVLITIGFAEWFQIQVTFVGLTVIMAILSFYMAYKVVNK